MGAYPGHTGFLMVVRGGCLLEIPGKDPISMASGDLVLKRGESGYTIKDHASSPAVSLFDLMTEENRASKLVIHGGGGAQTQLVMGCFEFETSAKNPLVTSLPDLLYVKAEDLRSEPWLDTTFRFLAAEASANRQGSDIVVSRLTDLLFIQAVRAHISDIKNCPNTNNFLKAVSDPQIGRALTLIHENPQAPWTVASLADAVSMSRSSFAARFHELIDESPLSYVTSWRMQKAQELIRLGVDNLADIASQIGYQSEAAFRKAFKRETGLAPGIFKRSAQS
jgi:AraC-like DNA-binding protein